MQNGRYVLGIAAGLVWVMGALSPVRPSHAAHFEPGETRDSPPSDCALGWVRDQGVCVPLPDPTRTRSELVAERAAHRDKQGRWQVYDQIPRRPERPKAYSAYRYPIPPGLPGGKSVVSGYDLDRPDRFQRRGAFLHAVGHGGVDLPGARGTPVRAIELEGQTGLAKIVFAGSMVGQSVVTLHGVREGGHVREYLLVHGHLERAADGAKQGRKVRADEVLGYVGDTGSPELVHLHLEARRVRDGVDIEKRPPADWLNNAYTVPCDPRNILPLRHDG